eukprot:5896147-Karenia_brevis.AAC.1
MCRQVVSDGGQGHWLYEPPPFSPLLLWHLHPVLVDDRWLRVFALLAIPLCDHCNVALFHKLATNSGEGNIGGNGVEELEVEK